MKGSWLLSLLVVASNACGQLHDFSKDEQPRTLLDRMQCSIPLFLSKSDMTPDNEPGRGNRYTHLFYKPVDIPKGCDGFIGEHIQAISASLGVQTRPSYGQILSINFGKDRINWFDPSLALSRSKVIISNVILKEWVGPVEGFDKVVVHIMFSGNAEGSLYPYDLKLTISKKDY